MYSSDSSSDTSSERSLSPSSSPPGLAFANPIAVPLKSLLSPPTTTDYFSLSPATPPSCPFNSPNNSICAFPSWPAGDCLTTSITSPTTTSSPCSYLNKPASSHISDDDLLDLEELELRGGMRIATGFPSMQAYGDGCIPWEATRQPPIVIKLDEGRREKAKANNSARPKGRRRRSSPLKDKRLVVKMSPIAEGQE